MHVLANASTRRKIDFLGEESEGVKNLMDDIDDLSLFNELEENGCEVLENYGVDQGDSKCVDNKKNGKKSDGKNNKQKKGKVKEQKDVIANEIKTNNNDSSTKIKSHSKKPYDKQKYGKTASKKSSTSAEKEKTDPKSTIKENKDSDKYFLENKLHKTETLENFNRNKFDKDNNDTKTNLSCDIDKNNNSDGSCIVRDGNKCDKKNKINELEIKEENFDFVINDAEKFFESFLFGYSTTTTASESANKEEIIFCNRQTAEENISNDSVPDKGVTLSDIAPNDGHNLENYNDFCSQTDEETENCVTEICDKVPTIVESLSNEDKEDLSDEFERNDITCELLSTLFGMKKLMENLLRRRVKVAKPDAFVVEHIDFFVTIIKRDKNKINPVYYCGHNYDFLNSELAFSTLQNNTGLFLVKM